LFAFKCATVFFCPRFYAVLIFLSGFFNADGVTWMRYWLMKSESPNKK
jgi:hypothetical protein